MIDEIHMRDVALIREATLLPATGLTVVTGETGAGKTALLSGVKLLVGERGGVDMIRDGAESLQVEGRFFPSSSAGDSNDYGEAGFIAQRSIARDGRSRVHINGTMASVGDLAAGPGSRIDLCGQHAHQQLLKTANQVKLLDAWAGDKVRSPRDAYAGAFRAVAAARRAFEQVQEAGRADSARIEEARYTLRRIEEVNPVEGEYEELLVEAARIENAEELIRTVTTVREALDAEDAALDGLSRSITALEGVRAYDEQLANQAEPLKNARFIVEDVLREAGSRYDDEAFDAQRLEQVQERLAAFQGLMRAYGPTMEEVMVHRTDAREAIAAVDDREERLAQTQQQLDAAEEALQHAAAALDADRGKAAPRFAEAVCAQMDDLEMGGAELVCDVEPLERGNWTEAGPSRVEFMFRPGQGMSTRPLARIASGGEISRVMLAIKVVLGEADQVDTLVFDEVDAGVGGKTARAVAEVLAHLAQTHQVIVVTHLAQIAVEGDVHYLVEKTAGDLPETTLARLEGDARVDEVARMLSGEVSETSRAHAREMLQAAARN